MKTVSPRTLPHRQLRRLPAMAGLTSLCLALLTAAESAVPIGSQPAKFEVTDIRFVPRTLTDFGQPKAFVIAFTTVDCPVTQRYLPRLNELAAQYRGQGVQFLAVNV